MPPAKKKAKKAKKKTAKKAKKKAAPKKKLKLVRKRVKKTVKKPAKKPVKKAVKKKVKKAVRKPVKKAAKKATKAKAAVSKPAAPKARKSGAPSVVVPAEPLWHLPREGEVLVGVVEDYLSHLEVVLTTLKVPLAVGETVAIRGFTTDLQQVVASIQIEHLPVERAEAGQAIGFKVTDKVRKNDHIFKK